MAIGELLYEESGKQTGIRVLESLNSLPIAEISGLGSLKFEGVAINTVWTMHVRLADEGISFVKENGIMYGENTEVASYIIEGITRPNKSGGSSSRGTSKILTTGQDLLLVSPRAMIKNYLC
ncbi:MAG TPA: hypothetical protein VH796_18485 [Nitrososphaeraceae archaeon]|jgi:hypothetical protein